MLTNTRGGRGRAKTRGALRGTSSGTSSGTSRTTSKQVRFDNKDGATVPSGPSNRGTTIRSISRALPRQPSQVRGALSRTFDNQPRAQPSAVSRGQEGTFQQRYQVVRITHLQLLTRRPYSDSVRMGHSSRKIENKRGLRPLLVDFLRIPTSQEHLQRPSLLSEHVQTCVPSLRGLKELFKTMSGAQNWWDTS